MVLGGSLFSTTKTADLPGTRPIAARTSRGSDTCPWLEIGRGPWGVAITFKVFFTMLQMAAHAGRPVGLVSVGYGGRRLAALIQVLSDERVELLIDVRMRPVSAIPGFSGRSLERALAEVGIGYRHTPTLGNPPENRAPFHDGAVQRGRTGFLKLLAVKAARDALKDLAEIANKSRVAVLCAERDQSRCHRQVIVEQLQQLSPTLGVTVLT